MRASPELWEQVAARRRVDPARRDAEQHGDLLGGHQRIWAASPGSVSVAVTVVRIVRLEEERRPKPTPAG